MGLATHRVMERAEKAERPRTGPVELEPETVLPSQFYGRMPVDASLQPEKRLMLAVLEDAVGTYQKYAFSRERNGERLFAEAEEWIESVENEWPYSFANICDALGLEHEFLRSGLRRWRDRHVAAQFDSSKVVRFPFRRVNGTRHAITGRPVGLRRSA